ncbi:MAG TPA: tRNA (N6-threonylcarbamoyladenosine(37)-N6)-methyltransferase TrmO [Sedimentisphaerales bacterium]|nr:tRNA (N6-threonylcarbamoyladenosine(37)-N6)-methyltransferase TrmO [Sedimentisphaerales bacterium]HNU31885.1 tRNA (N6-threonylcarbamoyladenosine(37)-N6)-methyltransferase TrmO [Sedimentisphaerales bacterium]
MDPIGIICSPFTQAAGTPVQASMAEGTTGTVEILPAFAAGLKDLDGFDRIWLLYWFDRTVAPKLIVTPYLDDQPHGVFATRAPARPNAIGMSAVRLLRIDGCILHVADVDILDGTPLLDIKPYVPQFDHLPAERTGRQSPAGCRPAVRGIACGYSQIGPAGSGSQQIRGGCWRSHNMSIRSRTVVQRREESRAAVSAFRRSGDET